MNFPFLPGIPPLLEKIIPAAAVLASGPIGAFLQSLGPTWEVLDQKGNKILNPDSFIGIQFSNDHRISDYPVEQGSFAYYNTVQNPFRCNVRMAKGGSEDERREFLNAVDWQSKILDLCTLVTPEATYNNLSIERYDYMRSASNGANMIVVDIHFLEIRLAQNNITQPNGTPHPTATVPQAQAQVHIGQIAPTTPSAAALASILNTPIL